jgi:SAM-dependent methyltransferase
MRVAGDRVGKGWLWAGRRAPQGSEKVTSAAQGLQLGMNCRVCAAGAQLWGDRGDVALFRCGRCGFVSGEPREKLSTEYRYHAYHSSVPLPPPEARYGQWLAKAEGLVGRGRLIEVGAGSGGFVRVALARGWKVDATEVSESGLQALRATGATVFAGDLASGNYADAQFDLVVSVEVIEHLPAPLDHVREMWRVTRPGGLLILTTPNFNGLSRRHLGIRWRVIDPEHLGYFTPSTLSRLLRDVGYTSVRVRARSLDVLSWRRCGGPREVARFDPQVSAHLRDTVERSRGLRIGKAVVNAALEATGLGDSLSVWARR